MSSLPLAIEIADLIESATEQQRELNVRAEASRLLEAYPDTEATREQLVEVLLEEGEAAGLAP